MAGVLVVCHGRLAHELLASARMIVGSAGTATAVEFPPAGMDVSDLASSLDTAVGELAGSSSDSAGVLILADLPGGAPARAAATLAAAGRAEVVTGVSLAMLAEVLLADPGLPAAEVAGIAVRAGKAGVLNLGTAIRDQEDRS